MLPMRLGGGTVESEYPALPCCICLLLPRCTAGDRKIASELPDGVLYELQIAQSMRRLPAGGPVGRAQAARWLTFAGAQLPAALGHANALAREFALGLNAAPGPSAAAGWALMHEVGPRLVPKLSDCHHKRALDCMHWCACKCLCGTGRQAGYAAQ